MGTTHDRAALTLVARLARRFGAQVTLFHLVRPGGAHVYVEQEVQNALAQEFLNPLVGARDW